MKIGQKEQALAFILHLHPVLDRAKIVAKMQIAGGLNAGYDAHVHAFELFAGVRRKRFLSSLGRYVPSANIAIA